MSGISKIQKGATRERRVQEVLTSAAKYLFTDDHPKGNADRNLPQRNGRGQRETEQDAGDKKALVDFVSPFHGKQDFPQTTNNKRHRVNGHIKHCAIDKTIPQAVRVIACHQRNDHAAPTFKGRNTQFLHRSRCVMPNHIHANEHREESAPPNGRHHALHINRIANMGLTNSRFARRVKNSVDHFINRVVLFVLSTLVEVRLQAIHKRS